jgi:hypothetical protein
VSEKDLTAKSIYGKYKDQFTERAQKLMNTRKMASLVEREEDGSVIMAAHIGCSRPTEEEAAAVVIAKVNGYAAQGELGGHILKLVRLEVAKVPGQVTVVSFVGVIPEAYRELTEPKLL